MSKLALSALGWLIPGLYLTFSTALGLSNVFMLLILIGFVATANKGYLEKARWPMPAVWLLALYVMVLLGMLYTPAPWEWSSINWGKYTKFVYAIVLILLLHGRSGWQRRSLMAFEIGMLFILASTWLNIWFILPWSTSKVLGWGNSHHVLSDHIVQNVMMGFFVAYALSKLSSSASRVWNASYAVIALMALVSVTHLSTGRTGLIVVAGALAAFLFALIGARRALLAVPILLIGLGALLMTSDVMLGRFQQATTELQKIDNDNFSSIGHRAYNYKTTPRLIAEKPLFGHGTGAYHTEICRVLEDPNDCATFRWHSHNQFLFFGADHGLVGIALYISLLLSAARVAWRAKSNPHRLMLFSLLGALVSDSMINSPLFSARESHFFLYLLGLLVVMCQGTPNSTVAAKPPPLS
ncbi:O-antigen ligase family protein [Shewanella sp.]|uniref:O-antigen ligase family protein n=1 Tax=Shewanella sp. TaxID=50422 RepID=UPI0040480D68